MCKNGMAGACAAGASNGPHIVGIVRVLKCSFATCTSTQHPARYDALHLVKFDSRVDYKMILQATNTYECACTYIGQLEFWVGRPME